MSLLYREVEAGLSADRLSPYLEQARGDREAAVQRYLWNLALSESLYPLFHLSEVVLRNGFHRALSEYFGTEHWYDEGWLQDRETAQVQEARKKVQRGRRPETDGRLVAELTFGFWCTLFDSRYEHGQVLWPHLLRMPVFQHVPRKLRTRKAMSGYANRLRTLRNRVFHHEPIWAWDDLPKRVDESEDWLRWLNPEVAKLLPLVDRFRSINAAGWSSISRIPLT